ESLFGTEPARCSNDAPRTPRKHAFQQRSFGWVRMRKAVGANGVTDDGQPLVTDASAAHLGRLPFGNTDHAVHPPQVPAIQTLIQPDPQALARPTARHGHGGNTGAAGRGAAQKGSRFSDEEQQSGRPAPPSLSTN